MSCKTLKNSILPVFLVIGLMVTMVVITGCKEKTTHEHPEVKCCGNPTADKCCAKAAAEKAACDAAKACGPGCTKPCCADVKKTIEKAEDAAKEAEDAAKEAVDDATKACPAGCACVKCEAKKLVK